ncbi:heat-inducible transcriptional repressor HrcA [Mycoplasma cottewii]|uniref:Heat-inducible transcription repressor HrcA n=1 Tax=Mycoplasma cottewii TaxID=51364 RepID=A0ABY5TXG3_9MOLU|nr:heat-inducible transcriptional repressor HrcA [Mycoplasma cottewii]UWD35327.1 heat-inducible transcriptional repressor HrcA [Mycoplasma cottewii]
MLKERQIKILEAIVKEFIKTNQPVGSKRILELLDIKVSSATIRSESVVLEELGYLEKQHTSSGRTPSTKGYRFYVDNIMKFNNNEDKDLKKYLQQIFELRNYNVDKTINYASEIISEITKMTAVVVKKTNFNDINLKKIDLVIISDQIANVVFIFSDGSVQNKVFNLNDISLEDLQIAIKLFSDSLLEVSLDQLNEHIDKLKEQLALSIKQYDYVLNTFISTILDSKTDQKEIHGMRYMLENPEFSDTEKLKKAVKLMEEITPFQWFDIAYESNKSLNKISTKIGNEINENIDDIAMVGTELKVGENSTVLTLIGPKRIDYSQVNRLMNLIIEILEGKDLDYGKT